MRAKHAALRRAGAFPTPANRSYVHTLQLKVRERILEVRNDNWSALMEEIAPIHKAYWQVAKALKSNSYELVPALRNPDNITFEDREKAECLANSIERKALGLNGISNKAIKYFFSSILAMLVVIFNACLKNCHFPEVEKDAVLIGIPKPGKPRDLPASSRPISLLSSLGKLYERILYHLIKKGLIIDGQFGFLSHHLYPQQALRLVEYISEGFKRKRKTVAVFCDVTKAIDRVWHAGLIHKLYTLEVPDRLVLILHRCPDRFADDSTLFLRSASFNHIIPGFQRAIDELTQWYQFWRIEVNLKKDLQVIQNKFCRRATDAQWYIKNSVLHKDLELPTLNKYMKDTSERFYNIAINHPNPLISAAASYKAPSANHFLKRPRNALLDPPDKLTAEGVRKGQNSIGMPRRSERIIRRRVTRRRHLCTPTVTCEARAAIKKFDQLKTLSIILPTHLKNLHSEATVKDNPKWWLMRR
ncbi:RNA-directed DNA polymerase from mobile element jockey [Eumeta japonica]|uniref:RNA-directed DNA polymerase from mobile element jockey n=1 Tax=Eumeta variegata TaxID=151549 RepID=A0A4C1U1I4_EUMVA|nr:RNA-directed DNA polymerase from mobile element jockey [Eumeta japonica]